MLLSPDGATRVRNTVLSIGAASEAFWLYVPPIRSENPVGRARPRRGRHPCHSAWPRDRSLHHLRRGRKRPPLPSNARARRGQNSAGGPGGCSHHGGKAGDGRYRSHEGLKSDAWSLVRGIARDESEQRHEKRSSCRLDNSSVSLFTKVVSAGGPPSLALGAIPAGLSPVKASHYVILASGSGSIQRISGNRN